MWSSTCSKIAIATDQNRQHSIEDIVFIAWARILVQITIYRRLRIGRDGHLDHSEAYDIP